MENGHSEILLSEHEINTTLSSAILFVISLFKHIGSGTRGIFCCHVHQNWLRWRMKKVERVVLTVLTRIWHKHWHSKALYLESTIFAADKSAN